MGVEARSADLTFTARLDDRLDKATTEGKPLRLRVVATRTVQPHQLPAAPLVPAKRALNAYARTGDLASRMRVMLPVRVRAALMNRTRKGPRRAK